MGLGFRVQGTIVIVVAVTAAAVVNAVSLPQVLTLALDLFAFNMQAI